MGEVHSESQEQDQPCDFLTSSLCKLGQERLPRVNRLVIAGRFKGGEMTVCITRESPTEEIAELKSKHEEADTRMILHAVGESPTSSSMIQSPTHRCSKSRYNSLD